MQADRIHGALQQYTTNRAGLSPQELSQLERLIITLQLRVKASIVMAHSHAMHGMAAHKEPKQLAKTALPALSNGGIPLHGTQAQPLLPALLLIQQTNSLQPSYTFKS